MTSFGFISSLGILDYSLPCSLDRLAGRAASRATLSELCDIILKPPLEPSLISTRGFIISKSFRFEGQRGEGAAE